MNLIFFDIDGTLLPEGNKEISPKVLAAIENLKSNKTEIFICTGRCYNQAKKYIDDLGIINYICSNGQEICYKGRIIYQHHFSETDSEELSSMCDVADILWACETRMGLRVSTEFKNVKLAEQIENHGFLNVKYAEKMSKEVFQFWTFSSKTNLDKFKEKIESKFTMYRWNDICAEIMPLNQSKGNAIKILKESIDLDVRTFAFGDGINDVEMLKVVDHSFAMKNGVKEVKEIAEYECGFCNEDGIIKGIEILRSIE